MRIQTMHDKLYYDDRYVQPNYFRYREWLYRPYVSSLISFSGLKAGSVVLDVGCGQGFFSYLLSKCGTRVHGVDISETGIMAAQNLYGRYGITFEVADIGATEFASKFDVIFVRSCSLYNTESFVSDDEITRRLLRYLKDDGIFIFAYNSAFSSKTSPGWRYHSLHDVAEHFRKYSNKSIFFCNKIDTWLFRRYAFSSFVTRLNALLSKLFGIRGELICVLRGPREAQLQNGQKASGGTNAGPSGEAKPVPSR